MDSELLWKTSKLCVKIGWKVLTNQRRALQAQSRDELTPYAKQTSNRQPFTVPTLSTS